MTGSIFNIQRFSTNDGPGIRTVVFLKGCPLSCIWCHNPESKEVSPDIFYDKKKCIGCRKCEMTCELGQHLFNSGQHIFLRKDCKKCQKCALMCPTGAIEFCGKEVSSEEVLNELIRDEEFFIESGGGVTLSGGEPLMQFDFSLEILKKVKKHGIHTAIETSGYSFGNLSEISKYVDLWLYDIKLLDEDAHIKCTGVSNKKILENIHFLDSIGAKLILRCPIIPKVNLSQEHFDRISVLANNLKNVIAIHFEPYHPLGIDKAFRLGKIQKYDNKDFLSIDNIQQFVNQIKDKTAANIEIL